MSSTNPAVTDEETNIIINPSQHAADAGAAPSIKQLIDFESLAQLIQTTAKLAANLNERLGGGAKGGFYLDGGRISNTNLKQQMEEVCALKKKIEDLEPVMKKAVIMAEPEPAQEAPVSKRAARGKGGKAVAAASAVTDDHEKRIADLENLIKSQSERMKKTEDENKKLGALIAQLETKAGKQAGSSQAPEAQIQALNTKIKTVGHHSEQIAKLSNRVSSLETTKAPQTALFDPALKQRVSALELETNTLRANVFVGKETPLSLFKQNTAQLEKVERMLSHDRSVGHQAHIQTTQSLQALDRRVIALEARPSGVRSEQSSVAESSEDEESDYSSEDESSEEDSDDDDSRYY